jgi:predicted nucleic acid-binding protein
MKLLTLFGETAGNLYVNDQTPGVDATQLSRQDCEAQGIAIIEATLKQLIEAETWHDRRRLSRYDRLNIIMARDSDLILIVNDKNQWECAQTEGVTCIRGLRMMLELVRRRKLPPAKAKKALQRMQDRNNWITQEVVEEFVAQLDGMEKA